MKIVSWNCGGGFRKKILEVEKEKADIYIIQECEDPNQITDVKYKNWMPHFIWNGKNKNKGVGIFSTGKYTTREIRIINNNLELFLPILINERIILIGVWNCEANSPTFQYIGQLWQYIQKYKTIFKKYRCIFVGDFNSNKIWDKHDRWWNHTDVVHELGKMRLKSLYHEYNQEEQGKESAATFYMYRKQDRPYHIDYAFVPIEFIKDSKINIGKYNDWHKYSDHMPLSIEICQNIC